MTHNLDENTFKSLQNNLNKNEIIIIKFTADWCAPCNSIKEYIHDIVKTLPDKIKFYEIDVDDSIELYAKFKNKKMLNGIPALLAFKDGEKDIWYIPDDSILGADKAKIRSFFDRSIKYVS